MLAFKFLATNQQGKSVKSNQQNSKKTTKTNNQTGSFGQLFSRTNNAQGQAQNNASGRANANHQTSLLNNNAMNLNSKITELNPLFIKPVDMSAQNLLPSKMTIDNLVNLIAQNKVEVFINNNSQMHNVTSFFKSNDSIKELLSKKTVDENINLFQNKQNPVKKNTKTSVNDKFIEFNLYF